MSPNAGNAATAAFRRPNFVTCRTAPRDMHLVLEHMAYIDRLTELPNRSHFHEYLQQRTKNHSQTPFALFVMDLDRFKEVNDTFGHDIGDQLIKQVSSRLKGVLYRSDMPMRPDESGARSFPCDVHARKVSPINSAADVAHKFPQKVAWPV